MDSPTELFNQAQIFKDNGQNTEAINLFQQAAQIFQEGNDQKKLAECYQMTGICYTIAQQPDQAQKCLTEAYQLFTQLSDHSGSGNCARDMALSYLNQSDLEAARQWFDLSANHLQQTGNKVALGITLAKSAILFRKLHQFEQAGLVFEQGLTLIRETGEWFMESTVLLDWAQLERKQKNYHQMLNKLWAALGLIKHFSEPNQQQRRLAEIYGHLAYGYLKLNNFNWAVKLFSQSLKMMVGIPESVRQLILKNIKARKFLVKLQNLDSQAYQTLISNSDLSLDEE